MLVLAFTVPASHQPHAPWQTNRLGRSSAIVDNANGPSHRSFATSSFNIGRVFRESGRKFLPAVPVKSPTLIPTTQQQFAQVGTIMRRYNVFVTMRGSCAWVMKNEMRCIGYDMSQCLGCAFSLVAHGGVCYSFKSAIKVWCQNGAPAPTVIHHMPSLLRGFKDVYPPPKGFKEHVSPAFLRYLSPPSIQLTLPPTAQPTSVATPSPTISLNKILHVKVRSDSSQSNNTIEHSIIEGSIWVSKTKAHPATHHSPDYEAVLSNTSSVIYSSNKSTNQICSAHCTKGLAEVSEVSNKAHRRQNQSFAKHRGIRFDSKCVGRMRLATE